MARHDAIFLSGGTRCAAYVHHPGETDGEAPAVILAHGFAGTRDAGLEPFAERFAAAGLVAVVFDYRGFGASEGTPRQVVDIARQREDWTAALAWTRALEGVDATRVALWGTSFSGGHVVELAAADPAVAAVVAQVPFADGLATLRTERSPRDVARLALLALRDRLAARRGGDAVEIPAVAEPGQVGAMTTPDALPGYLRLAGESPLWENRVAARVLIDVLAWRPVRRAARVRCPLLVCIAEDDRITPGGPAARIAARAPRGELRRYPHAGHFDVYVPPLFDRLVEDQTDFLVRHLLPGGASAAA